MTALRAYSAASPLDGFVLCVDSAVLGERVIFVGDDFVSSPDDPIAYTAAELYLLLDESPDMLRLVHGIKKTFRGARVSKRTEDSKMNSLDKFLLACRPASVAAEWLVENEIDPEVADARGCRWCGHEFSDAIENTDLRSFGPGLSVLRSWCSPQTKVAALLVPYVRLGETIGIKAIPCREIKPPAVNLTSMPWPLWIDDLQKSGSVFLAWGELAALQAKSKNDDDKIVIGIPGFWKTLWAPLFEGRDIIVDCPSGQKEKIMSDLKTNGAKNVA
jgi:hypothetical protein